MEIEVGIETLDGSNGKSNGFLRITSSSLGASLVDHLSTIRFHAILCLLFFFSFPPPLFPPSFAHFHRVMTRGCLAARNHRLWRWLEFREGRGGGISTFAWRTRAFSRDFFNCQRWGGDASFRDSWILPSKRR